MEYILQEGRPANETGRLEKEIRTYDLLDKLEISYQRLDHEAVMTIDACVDVDKALGVEICKNLFLCNAKKTQFYLLMMPGEKKFVTKEFSHQLETTRVSFAKEEYLLEFLDITPGSVSVMGLMNDHENHVQLVIDKDVIRHDQIACHPCINTSSIVLSTKDLLEKYLPAIHHEPVYIEI